MSLPFEVWSMIFCLLPVCSHLDLMCVCRAWRDIVNGTPELWSYLPFPVLLDVDPGIWLEKSGEHPLEVVIKSTSRLPRWRRRYPALERLHNHVRRIRVLNIHVFWFYDVDFILSSIAFTGELYRSSLALRGHLSPAQPGNPAPLLEQLLIYVTNSHPGFKYSPYYEHAFYPCPRLWKLDCHAFHIPSPSSKLLSTVTAFSMFSGTGMQDRPPVEKVLPTIKAIPHLKSLTYNGRNIFWDRLPDGNHYPAVTLPHLEVVDLSVPTSGLDILESLEAPNLRYVKLDGWTGERDDPDALPHDHMTAIFEILKNLPQQAPYIRILKLCRIRYLHPDTYDWLFNENDLAHLEELSIIEAKTLTDEAFTQSSSHGPRLCRLELKECENITGGALVDYIEAKRLSGHGNFCLVLEECPGVGDKDLVELSRLVTMGTDVTA